MTEPERLTGNRVLVTRPEERAAGLIEALSLAGTRPIAFPVIRIAPVPPEQVGRDWPCTAPAMDLWVFASVAAVSLGVPLLGQPGDQRPRVAAVGPATARALTAAGLRVDIVPTHGMDSEALLATPAFAPARLQGANVLLVRGADGRTVLADTIRARGGSVHLADVYRREPIGAAGTRSLPDCDMVTLTSLDIARQLLSLLRPADAAHVRTLPVVTVSDRIAAELRELGFTDKIAVAPGADDDAVTQTVVTAIRTAQGLLNTHE